MDSNITAEALLLRLKNGEYLNLLDVREELEYHTFNIGGKNIPLQAIKNDPAASGFGLEEEIIVVCSAGLRSKTAAAILADHGYQNVLNLTGGLRALQKIRNQEF